jgi:hypothetical protein
MIEIEFFNQKHKRNERVTWGGFYISRLSFVLLCSSFAAHG